MPSPHVQQLHVSRISPRKWKGTIQPTWQVGKVPSGGYITALLLKCITEELKAASKESPLSGRKHPPNAHPDILTANCHFLSSSLPGDFSANVEILKSGRTTSTGQASLFQDGIERFRCIASCGDYKTAAKSGPNMFCLAKSSTPPQLPPINQCKRVQAGDNTPQSVRSRVHLMLPEIAYKQYLDCRRTQDDGTFDEEVLLRRAEAVKDGNASYAGYCFFADGSEPTLAAAPLYLDASVPPILGAYVTGWVPTINWTVQFKCHPKPGPLKFQFDTSTVNGGFLEEDGRLWDSEGRLIAMSRQLAMVGVSQSNKTRLINSKL